jgi:hypothetical protein
MGGLKGSITIYGPVETVISSMDAPVSLKASN